MFANWHAVDGMVVAVHPTFVCLGCILKTQQKIPDDIVPLIIHNNEKSARK
jgi:hypothetical protein